MLPLTAELWPVPRRLPPAGRHQVSLCASSLFPQVMFWRFQVCPLTWEAATRWSERAGGLLSPFMASGFLFLAFNPFRHEQKQAFHANFLPLLWTIDSIINQSIVIIKPAAVAFQTSLLEFDVFVVFLW